MDALGEDQALQAVLDRELAGIDNEALDFHFEDYISGEVPICLSDDLPAASYSSGRMVQDCALAGSKSCSSTSAAPDLHTSHHLNCPVPPHPQSIIQHPLSHQQHHQHQQQQVSAGLQQEHQHLLHSANSMYCNIGQGRVTFDQHHLHQTSTPLPDSPPDSGSEPYSPQDHTPNCFTEVPSPLLSDRDLIMFNSQQKHSHNMPTVPQTHYPGPQQRIPAMPDLGIGPPAYLGGPEPPKMNHMPVGPQAGGMMSSHPFLPSHFGSMSNLVSQPNKKRKFSDSPTNTISASVLPPSMNGVLSIKQEQPTAALNQFSQYVGDCGDDDYSFDMDPNMGFVDGAYQVIKWQNFNASSWNTLTDANFKDLPMPTYRVDADKGFNYSVPDEAFVCQKKNHFQVTVHIGLQGNPKYIRTPEGVKKIEDFYVHFHGVKVESQSQTIKIEQSQSDRSKKPFHPVKMDLVPDQVVKLTVGRLHYSETTSNNMRKKGKPNPDQRYFKLVVALQAHSGHNAYLICAHSSERIIVRASNPGQFDSEVDVMWQKGHTSDSVYHVGRVGINTDHPEEALAVHGNMRLTGHLLQPSDIRAKENIQELDSKDQLENVQKLRIYRYDYKDDFATHAGIAPDRRQDTGVLAQEILDVLPDAVQSTGDIRLATGSLLENFLVVNKDRIFMENVGAVKELCKLTDNLEVRIDELEKMNKRLAKLRRYDSLKSTNSLKSISSGSTFSNSGTVTPPQKKNTSIPDSSSSVSHNSSNSKKNYSNGSRNHHRTTQFSQHRRNSASTLSSMPKMCGNRFLQITILILILIMAFCLVAITTLYIMELQKDSGDSSSTPVYQVTPAPSHQSTLHPEVSSSLNHSNRSGQIHQFGGNASTTAVPSATSSSIVRMTTTTKDMNKKTTVSLSPSVEIPLLPAYPLQSCQKENCELLCCPLPSEDMPSVVITGGGGGGYGGGYIQENDSGGEGEGIDAEHGENEGPPLDTTATHNGNTVVAMSQSRNTTNNFNNNIQLVVNGERGPAYHIITGGRVDHFVYRRQVRNSIGDIRLIVKELNVTIGQNFCHEGCQSNNQSYFIPMAPFFGFEPITLQFRMNKSRHVALCHGQPVAVCPGATNRGPPISETKNGTQVEWSLFVGLFVQTEFFFRVADDDSLPDISSDEICSTQPHSGLLQDYRLTFKRTCPLNID